MLDISQDKVNFGCDLVSESSNCYSFARWWMFELSRWLTFPNWMLHFQKMIETVNDNDLVKKKKNYKHYL